MNMQVADSSIRSPREENRDASKILSGELIRQALKYRA